MRNRILELTFLFEDLPVYLLTLLAEVLDALHELVVVVLKSLRDRMRAARDQVVA